MIVTLHRGNATADKLPRMHDWFRELERMGVRSARLHVLEVDEEGVGAAYALSTQENLDAFRSFATLERELTELRLDLFQDMRNLLTANDDSVTCVWNACDPYTTQRGARRGGFRPGVELRSHQQGRHRLREVVAGGVRALPRALPDPAGARRLP